jgi:hypothetical protein
MIKLCGFDILTDMDTPKGYTEPMDWRDRGVDIHRRTREAITEAPTRAVKLPLSAGLPLRKRIG